ncbi:MAG: MFS transporter, partial [Lachnospiraceae bacterium]|nr:MFS transporter [Lachnospiraceae bacterium]
YLSIYCTDTLGITPALVSVILVGSKILDAFSDVIAGYIVDNTHTRWGKGRPYEWSIVGMWLSIWLMFTTPVGFSTIAKCVWIFCMYALVNSVFYTLLTANNNVYCCRAFRYQEQYVSINSTGAIISMVGVAAFNIAIPTLVDNIAVDASGGSFLMACIAIPMAMIGILRFFFIKETVDVDVSAVGEKNKISFADVKRLLSTNYYIYIVAFTLFVCNFVTNMGVGVYYFTYVVQNLSMYSLVSAVQLLAIPMMLFVPKILKKISISRLILIGCVISVVGYVINYFALNNIALLGLAAVLYGMGSVPISMLINLMIIECADFNEWKGNPRMEGTLGSVTGFATKLGSAAGAGILGVLLTASGYIADVNLIPDSALSMIRSLYSIIPAILWLVVALTLLLYRLDKKMPQIRADLEQKRGENQQA